MNKYLFVLHQDGGCDYTIECGTAVMEVEAKNIIDAYQQLQNQYGLDSNMNYCEEEIDITLYEIKQSVYKLKLKDHLSKYNEYLKLKKEFEED